MTVTEQRRDRRAERHERTKAEILAAAWQLAQDRGLAGWALRDVADAVGMRTPSLYGYFASKAALYDAMFADGYAALLARIAAMPRHGGPDDVLRRGAHLFFAFCVESPARFTLLFLRTLPGFTPSDGAYGLSRQALDGLATALADAGAGSPADVDLFTALLTGLATQQVSNDPGGDRWARLVDDAVALFLSGRRAA